MNDYSPEMFVSDTLIAQEIVSLQLIGDIDDEPACEGDPRRAADLYLCGMPGGLDPESDYEYFKQLGGVSHAVYLMVYNRAVVDFLYLT